MKIQPHDLRVLNLALLLLCIIVGISPRVMSGVRAQIPYEFPQLSPGGAFRHSWHPTS